VCLPWKRILIVFFIGLSCRCQYWVTPFYASMQENLRYYRLWGM